MAEVDEIAIGLAVKPSPLRVFRSTTYQLDMHRMGIRDLYRLTFHRPESSFFQNATRAVRRGPMRQPEVLNPFEMTGKVLRPYVDQEWRYIPLRDVILRMRNRKNKKKEEEINIVGVKK